MRDRLDTELDAIVGEYYARFGAMDFAAMRAHWDAEESRPTYLAEENRDFLYDWPAIEAYWADTRRWLSRLAARHEGLRAHALAPDLALATWSMHWDAQVAGHQRPIGGDVRVTATFRRRPSGWKLVAYVEAPLAPIVYVRALYERQVTPGFGA